MERKAMDATLYMRLDSELLNDYKQTYGEFYQRYIREAMRSYIVKDKRSQAYARKNTYTVIKKDYFD